MSVHPHATDCILHQYLYRQFLVNQNLAQFRKQTDTTASRLLPSFSKKSLEITRTLSLLFILLHLNGNATMRLEGLTLLLWSELPPMSSTSKERPKAQNVPVKKSCFGSCYFVDDCKRYTGHNIMTQSVQLLKWTKLISMTNRRYQSMNQALSIAIANRYQFDKILF